EQRERFPTHVPKGDIVVPNSGSPLKSPLLRQALRRSLGDGCAQFEALLVIAPRHGRCVLPVAQSRLAGMGDKPPDRPSSGKCSRQGGARPEWTRSFNSL